MCVLTWVYVCYNVCVYEESVHSLETGNTGVCELPDVIAGIYTRVLGKGSKC